MGTSAPGPDDIQIAVTLNTTKAKQETQKMDDAFRQVGANFGKYTLRGLAAGLGIFFGESAMASRANIFSGASNLGRATGIGQTIEQDTARRSAFERARGATAEMLGPAGQFATKAEIMALFNAFFGIEKREALGRQRVEGVIDQQRAKQLMDEILFFFKNFAAVTREMEPPSMRKPPELR